MLSHHVDYRVSNSYIIFHLLSNPTIYNNQQRFGSVWGYNWTNLKPNHLKIWKPESDQTTKPLNWTVKNSNSNLNSIWCANSNLKFQNFQMFPNVRIRRTVETELNRTVWAVKPLRCGFALRFGSNRTVADVSYTCTSKLLLGQIFFYHRLRINTCYSTLKLKGHFVYSWKPTIGKCKTLSKQDLPLPKCLFYQILDLRVFVEQIQVRIILIYCYFVDNNIKVSNINLD